MLVSVLFASSSSTQARKLCSRRGSFRRLIYQGLEPSRRRGSRKKMLKAGRVAVAGTADPPPFGWIRHHRGAEPRLTQTECAICKGVEVEQIAVDPPAALLRDQIHEAAAFHLIEVKFDYGPHNVPRGVLTSDQIVGLVMIKRIRLA